MISEKISCRLISRGKKHAKKFLDKQYPALKKILLMTYNAEKKFLHRYMRERGGGGFLTPEVWEKIITSKSPIPPPPQTSNGQVNHLGGGGRNGYVIRQLKWLARVHHVVVLKTKVLHFKIENTPIKGTNGKRKFNGMLNFLFVDK